MKLTEWSLTEDFWGNVQAHGYVTGHHRLAEGDWIHTSKVLSIESSEVQGSIKMHTYSGSLYELSVVDIDISAAEKTSELAQKMGLSENVCQEIIHCGKEKVEDLRRSVSEQIKERELYLTFRGVNVKNAFWKSASGECREVGISCHVGMIQDSMLIRDSKDRELDFRYFPGWGEIRPYAWSNGLEAVWIDNQSDVDFIFRTETESITCPGGEKIRIEKKEKV